MALLELERFRMFGWPHFHLPYCPHYTKVPTLPLPLSIHREGIKSVASSEIKTPIFSRRVIMLKETIGAIFGFRKGRRTKVECLGISPPVVPSKLREMVHRARGLGRLGRLVDLFGGPSYPASWRTVDDLCWQMRRQIQRNAPLRLTEK